MKLVKFLFTSLFLGIFVVSANAQGYNNITGQETEDYMNTITTSVPFLLIAPDAKGGAMGDVGAATTPDVYSMHYNPAKYAFMNENLGFSVSYSPWFNQIVKDINLAYLTGYKKIGDKQAIATSLKYFSMGTINFVDEFKESRGSFSPREFALDFAYARKFSDYISGSVALRYIYSNLSGNISFTGSESKPGQSIATDVSFFYNRDLDLGKTPSNLAFGVNISNIGSKITYSEIQYRSFIPINLRLGPALTMELDEYNKLLFAVDFNKLLVPTYPLYALDSIGNYVIDTITKEKVIAKGKDPYRSVVSGMFGSFSDAPGGLKEELREINIAVGAEYWYDNQFAIRGGFFYENKYKGNRKYFTLGAGLRYNVFGLDFSYLIPLEQRNPLENTLRFSLIFNFDKI